MSSLSTTRAPHDSITNARRLFAAVSITMLLVVGLAPSASAGFNSVDVSWSPSSPATGTDSHDSLEDRDDDQGVGTNTGVYTADFTIPSTARNGDVFEFRFWIGRIDGASDILRFTGCGGLATGLAPTPPHQIGIGGDLYFISSTARGCVYRVTVGQSLLGQATPGSRWQIRLSLSVTLDYECWDSDPITVTPVTCKETWAVSTLNGGTFRSTWHDTTIVYTTAPLPV